MPEIANDVAGLELVLEKSLGEVTLQYSFKGQKRIFLVKERYQVATGREAVLSKYINTSFGCLF